MANETKKERGPSGREACIAAIRAAGKPLTANQIASAVVDSGVVPTLKGKTPKATLSAQITAGAKKGEVFKRVGSGRPQKFDLRTDAPESPKELVDALRSLVQAAVKEQVAKRDGQAARPDPKPSARKQAAAV